MVQKRGTQAKEGIPVSGERPDGACLQWKKARAKAKGSGQVQRGWSDGQLPEEQGAS